MGYRSQRQRGLIQKKADAIVQELSRVGYSTADAIAMADRRIWQRMTGDRRSFFRYLTGRGPAPFKRFKV